MQLSIDIETHGTGHNARIIQLSAIGFDFNEGVFEAHELLQMDERCFNYRIAPYAGAQVDAGALQFWAQPEQRLAKTEIERMPETRIDDVLDAFDKFCGEWLGTRGHMWAKPPSFDLALIQDMYELHGRKVPWGRRQERDLRTLIYLAEQVPLTNFKVPDISQSRLIPHFALHDAAVQAVVAQSAFRSLTRFARQQAVPAHAKVAKPRPEKRRAKSIE